MDDGHVDRRQALGAGNEGLQPGVLVRDHDVGQLGTLGPQFLLGGEDFGSARNHLQSILIGAVAIEQNVVVVREHLFDRDRDGNGVADGDRFDKTDRLVDQDGAWAGKLRAQRGRDQRGAPHAVGNDFPEHAAVGKIPINDCRIDIAGHDGEELDVFSAQRARQ